MERKTLTSTEIRKRFGARLQGNVVRFEIRIPLPAAIQLEMISEAASRSPSDIVTTWVMGTKDPREILKEELRGICASFHSKLERLHALERAAGEPVETELYLPEVRP